MDNLRGKISKSIDKENDSKKKEMKILQERVMLYKLFQKNNSQNLEKTKRQIEKNGEK